MMTEEEIARLFGRAVGNVDWPGLDSTIMGAQRQARRLRRRRRVSLAASGALAAGVAGVAVAVATGTLPQLPGATSPHGPADASTTTPASSPVTPSPTPSPTSSPPPTGAQMLATLRTLLPAGSTISDVQPLQHIVGTYRLEVDYNNGQGAVDLMVIIAPPGIDNAYASCSQIPGAPPGQPAGPCTTRTLPDGSTEVDATAAPIGGVGQLEVLVLKPDGWGVQVVVANGNWDNPAQTVTITQPTPPGSFAQWSAVADSPAWHL
jgi:hypothetical protein